MTIHVSIIGSSPSHMAPLPPSWSPSESFLIFHFYMSPPHDLDSPDDSSESSTSDRTVKTGIEPTEWTSSSSSRLILGPLVPTFVLSLAFLSFFLFFLFLSFPARLFDWLFSCLWSQKLLFCFGRYWSHIFCIFTCARYPPLPFFFLSFLPRYTFRLAFLVSLVPKASVLLWTVLKSHILYIYLLVIPPLPHF